jgi:uncharacterized protein (TIGR00369 family)
MTVHEDWLESLKQYPEGLVLPPPSMHELQLEYLEVKPGERLVARLPFQERFTNPIGSYQGGFLSAGLDDVFGPLSYMTAKGPCLTLSLNVTFLRPFVKEMNHALITGVVLKNTKGFIFMRADVMGPNGDLLAHAESHVNKVRA